MNYYQHHIGDYRRDTAHLSLLEHGVYRQLLDMYYLSETNIPEETEVVYRRLCARTDEEKKAIDTVLAEFFKRENGWSHKRCDLEIAEYQGKADRARKNGKLGGRPTKTKVVIPGNPEETQTKANHKPLTINQEPLTINQEPTEQICTANAVLPEINTPISVPPRENVPFEKIIDLYHEVLPELPRCQSLTKKRRGHIRQRWLDGMPELEIWRDYFNAVRRSKFLMGKSQGTNGRPPFRASIDFLIREETAVKIEEKYYA